MYVVTLAGGAVATGLAVGAPIAAAVLAVDCLLGMASRAAPQVNLQDLGAPLRILGGGALVWLGVGVLCERLLAGVAGLGRESDGRPLAGARGYGERGGRGMSGLVVA